MKRLSTIILILLILALSGCTGQDVSTETGGQTFERSNPNLNGKMMNLELLPNDARAGENITANLVVGNIGKENIVGETIEIRAKVKSLDDSLANLALAAMSDQKKTMAFAMNFDEDIKPDTIKQLTYVFPTPRELKGRNLAGTYEITVILSVNGQKVESKTIKMRLRSGKPRDSPETKVNAQSGAQSVTPASTSLAAVTATAAVTMIATPTPTPTQVPTAVKVTVDTFLFGWNDVPGKDNSILTGYLKRKFGVDWVENANIEKGSDDKTINITSGKNHISLTLDDYKTTLSLAIDDGRKAEFSGVMVDGKLNIYSGIVRFTRIQGWKFTENDIKLDAGSWLQWRNMDDESFFTLNEVNGKLPNITVRSRTYYYFNTTGNYKFDLYYPKMREAPLPQTITVTLNQSQQ